MFGLKSTPVPAEQFLSLTLLSEVQDTLDVFEAKLIFQLIEISSSVPGTEGNPSTARKPLPGS